MTCVGQLFIIVTKLLRQSKLEREAIHSVSCLWSSQAMVCHSFPPVSIAKQQAHHGGITRLRNVRHPMSTE